MKKFIITVITAVLFTVPFATAGTNTSQLLHFELSETSNNEQPTEVKLRIPMSLLKALQPNIQEALDNAEFQNDQVDLQALWQEVKKAGPNQFIDINNAQEGHVNVSTTETHLLVKVTNSPQGDMSIEIPLELGDLFLAKEGPRQFDEMLQTLETFEGDLLRITGTNINARAWVD